MTHSHLSPVSVRQDELFKSAAAPLNTLVDLNNSIDGAVNKVKEAAGLLLGNYTVNVTGAGQYQIMKGDAKVELDAVKKDLAATPVVGVEAADHKKALDFLESSAKELEGGPATPAVDANGLCERERDNADNDAQIVAFNNAVIICRNQFATQVNFGTVITELKKLLKDITLSITGSCEEGLGVELSKPDLPPAAKAIWEALKACLEALKKCLTLIPDLKTDIMGIVEKAKEFPAKAKDAASAAGLGAMEIPGVIKAVGGNVKALGSAPGIITTLLGTVKDALGEIKSAVSG